MRFTKIIATIGPASRDPEVIQNLAQAGVNIFRLNFSHGHPEDLIPVIQEIRRLSDALGKPLGILGDLQGPKFRVEPVEGETPIPLQTGQLISLKAGTQPCTLKRLFVHHPELVKALTLSARILIDDGTIVLEVTERQSPEEVMCKVIQGGDLKSRKGVNVPGLKIDIPALTTKDRQDARFALEQGLDFLAMSFVQSHFDMLDLRRYLEECLEDRLDGLTKIPKLIAKIERPPALDDLDAILKVSDGMMVARGDLGVEMPLEQVPRIQKQIIRKANLAEVPVITATQILESMIHEASPTRAEVSDVANAILDGSDCLMLSGETAVGKYPVVCVETMSRIMEETEKELSSRNVSAASLAMDLNTTARFEFYETIAHSASFAAHQSDTRLIVVLSYSGNMARRISKQKPHCPIVALTPHKSVYRQLTLLWGVYPVLIQPSDNTDQTLLHIEEQLSQKGFLEEGDPVVFCAGNTHLQGMSNTLKLYAFGEFLHRVS